MSGFDIAAYKAAYPERVTEDVLATDDLILDRSDSSLVSTVKAVANSAQCHQFWEANNNPGIMGIYLKGTGLDITGKDYYISYFGTIGGGDILTITYDGYVGIHGVAKFSRASTSPTGVELVELEKQGTEDVFGYAVINWDAVENIDGGTVSTNPIRIGNDHNEAITTLQDNEGKVLVEEGGTLDTLANKVIGIGGIGVTVVGDKLQFESEPTASSVMSFFLHNDASSISGYEKALIIPSDGTADNDSVTLASASTEYIIGSYATDSGYPGTTSIPTGIWNFSFYGYVSQNSGTTNFRVKVYKRVLAGTETLLFTANSDDVNFTGSSQLVMFQHSISSPITLLATDRLVFKIYGITTATNSPVLYYTYNSPDYPTHITTTILNVDPTKFVKKTGDNVSGAINHYSTFPKDDSNYWNTFNLTDKTGVIKAETTSGDKSIELTASTSSVSFTETFQDDFDTEVTTVKDESGIGKAKKYLGSSGKTKPIFEAETENTKIRLEASADDKFHRIERPSTISTSSRMRASACSPTLNRVVMLSVDGDIAWSDDGVTFTKATATSRAYSEVCWGDGVFLAVSGTSGYVSISSDGKTWTDYATSNSADFRSVAWSEGLSMYMAVAASGTYRIMSSTNGTTWTNMATSGVDLTATSTGDWRSIRAGYKRGQRDEPCFVMCCMSNTSGTYKLLQYDGTDASGAYFSVGANPTGTLWDIAYLDTPLLLRWWSGVSAYDITSCFAVISTDGYLSLYYGDTAYHDIVRLDSSAIFRKIIAGDGTLLVLSGGSTTNSKYWLIAGYSDKSEASAWKTGTLDESDYIYGGCYFDGSFILPLYTTDDTTAIATRLDRYALSLKLYYGAGKRLSINYDTLLNIIHTPPALVGKLGGYNPVGVADFGNQYGDYKAQNMPEGTLVQNSSTLDGPSFVNTQYFHSIS